jgi:hypothetical protein
MCWFIINPKNGRYGRHVEKPSRGENLYLHNLAFDSFFEIGYAFHEFMAPYARPPFEDLVAFVIDGETRDSFRHLPQEILAEQQKAMRAFWAAWDAGEDGYRALLGRPMLREEKYWLLEHWLRRVAVGREQFYQGKTVAREEWLVDRHYYEDGQWSDGCYGRLRVFNDGTADAWWGAGLFGFSDEALARRELSGAKYRPWEEIENELFGGHFLPAPPPPSAFALDDSDVPFRYEG